MMIEPLTATVAHDRQQELLHQAQIDRLIRGAGADDHPRRRRVPALRLPTLMNRFFSAVAPGLPADEPEPAEDDTPAAA